MKIAKISWCDSFDEDTGEISIANLTVGNGIDISMRATNISFLKKKHRFEWSVSIANYMTVFMIDSGSRNTIDEAKKECENCFEKFVSTLNKYMEK